MATAEASGTAPSKQTQKITADFQTLLAAQLPFLKDLQFSTDEGMNKLTGIMIGPEETPYAGGHFPFVIIFLPEYPFKPPELHFDPPFPHPNIHPRSGIACHDNLLATWSPKVKLIQFLTTIHSLLIKPNYDTPVQSDVPTDYSAETARKWTEEKARPKS